jgi:hypothetical protein
MTTQLDEVTGVRKGRIELSTAASVGLSQEADEDDNLLAIQLPVRAPVIGAGWVGWRRVRLPGPPFQ